MCVFIQVSRLNYLPLRCLCLAVGLNQWKMRFRSKHMENSYPHAGVYLRIGYILKHFDSNGTLQCGWQEKGLIECISRRMTKKKRNHNFLGGNDKNSASVFREWQNEHFHDVCNTLCLQIETLFACSRWTLMTGWKYLLIKTH